MKRLFLLFLLLSVSPVFAQNATHFCTSMTSRIHIKARPGNPQYITQYSRKDFLRKTGGDFSQYTLGLTVSKLDVNIEIKPAITQQLSEICVGIQDVEVELKYPSIQVYIDKKYPPSSCEYQVIKEHEDYHVAVAQQALTFFKPDVERVVSDTLRGMTPKIVYSRSDIPHIVERQVKVLTNALQPVVKHINAKLAEKNKAIDTKEMYQATTAVCKNW